MADNTQSPVDWNALYLSNFGRMPDDQGLAWWQQNAQQYLDQGGQPALQQAFVNAAAPQDAGVQQRSVSPGMVPQSPQDWQAYMSRANMQDQGLNRMPGVFSDYGSLYGASPEQAQAITQQTPESLNAGTDRLLKMLEGWGGMGGLGGYKLPTAEDEKKRLIG